MSCLYKHWKMLMEIAENKKSLILNIMERVDNNFHIFLHFFECYIKTELETTISSAVIKKNC